MQFLKTLFYVMVAVVAVVFSMRNWTTVTVELWGGFAADAKLPVLLLAAFLLGFLPLFILHRTTRWSLRRRLENVERSLADVRGPVVATPSDPDILPPSATPLTVPPTIS